MKWRFQFDIVRKFSRNGLRVVTTALLSIDYLDEKGPHANIPSTHKQPGSWLVVNASNC